MNVISVDLGTSSCRSAVFDEKGQMKSLSTRPTPLINISAEHIEQDAELWWETVQVTIKEAVSVSCVSTTDIGAISVSSQGIAMVPVDKGGNALCNAISWLDTRSKKEMETIEKDFSREWLFKYSGKIPSAIYTLPKILWLKQNKTEIFKQIHKVLLPMDFILNKLCGRMVTDHSCAAGTMYYNIHTQTWQSEVLKKYGIQENLFPEIVWAGTPIGTLLPTVARKLGLQNLIVACGAQDQKCAALGAGIRPGRATISLGTASCTSLLTSVPALDEKRRIPCFSYLHPDVWVLEGIINTCASAYDWYRHIYETGKSYAEQDAMVEKVRQDPRDPVFFYPFFSGATSPYWQPHAKPAFIGMSFNTTRELMFRSVLEGIACNIRANLDAMEDIDNPIDELCVYGGMAKSSFFPQMIADITKKKVIVPPSSETALLGAALLALQACNKKSEGVEQNHRIFYPDKQGTSFYEDYYNEYEQTRQQLFNN